MQIFNVIKSFYGLFYAIHNSRFLQRLTAMWVAFFCPKNLHNSKKSCNFAPALEGVAEIVLQPSISMTVL